MCFTALCRKWIKRKYCANVSGFKWGFFDQCEGGQEESSVCTLQIVMPRWKVCVCSALDHLCQKKKKSLFSAHGSCWMVDSYQEGNSNNSLPCPVLDTQLWWCQAALSTVAGSHIQNNRLIQCTALPLSPQPWPGRPLEKIHTDRSVRWSFWPLTVNEL